MRTFFLARFVPSERGSTSVFFAIFAIVLLIGMGAGIDVGSWASARSATQSAADAAVLAGARALQTNPTDVAGALDAAKKFYAASLTARRPVVNDTVSFSTANNNTSIIATGNAYVKTPLLSFANVTELALFPTSQSTPLAKASITVGGNNGSNIEVALMLDVTGSMCDDGQGPCTTGSKIDGVKAAASDLVNIIVAADQSTYLSRVALVPFSTRVRVGPDSGGSTMMKKLTNLDASWSGWYNVCTSSTGSGGSESGGNWACQQYQAQQVASWPVLPCVTDRFYDATSSIDATDDPPGPGRWLNGHDGTRMVLSQDSSDTAPTAELGKTQADPAAHWNWDVNGCSDVDPTDEIMPLTSDKNALLTRISGLTASGSTAGALGTAFAWYTLSPNWSSIWDGGVSATGNTPAPYSDTTTTQANGSPLLRKIAVLLTDGGYNTHRGWKDEDMQMVSDEALQLCTNMKAKGIEVYTVGFALNQLPSNEQTIATNTLQSCGTDVSHFYQSLNTAQLQQAFRDIALKLSTLYLSE